MAFLAPIAGSIGSGISTALGIASTVLTTVGAISSAQAQAQAARYNAQVQEINAKTATDQAASIAAEKTKEMRQRLAAGRAAVMQNGFEVSGSPLDILNQAEDQGNLDYLTAVYEGKVRATGYENNATQYRMEANNDETAGFIGAATSLFGGLTSVYKNAGYVQMGV